MKSLLPHLFFDKKILSAILLLAALNGFSQTIITNFVGFPPSQPAYDLCGGLFVQMEATPIAGNYTYNWYRDEFGIGLVYVGTGLTFATGDMGGYYCFAIDANGNMVWSTQSSVLLVFNPNQQFELFMYGTGSSCTSAEIGYYDQYILDMLSWLNLYPVWYCNGVQMNPQTYSNIINTSVGGDYEVQINDPCSGLICHSSTVHFAPVGVISAGGSTSLCSGGAVTLTAASNLGYTFQWSRNNFNLAGATNASYVAHTSGTYHCVVSGGTCTNTSNDIVVTVYPNPTASINAAGPLTFCQGGSVTLNAIANNGTSFQWLKSNVNIAGATNSAYNAATSGNYKVRVTNANGCTKTSAAVTVTVSANPAATITPNGPTTFCAGQSVVLSANAGSGYTYIWKLNAATIAGATNINYTATLAGNYKVKVINSSGCSAFSSATHVYVPCKEGIQDNDSRLEIFPVPAENSVTIRNDAAPIESVSFYDLLGREANLDVIVITDREITFDVSQLPPGIYFAQVRSSGRVTTLNLVKD